MIILMMMSIRPAYLRTVLTRLSEPSNYFHLLLTFVFLTKYVYHAEILTGSFLADTLNIG